MKKISVSAVFHDISGAFLGVAFALFLTSELFPGHALIRPAYSLAVLFVGLVLHALERWI